jgi:hypothetical protein
MSVLEHQYFLWPWGYVRAARGAMSGEESFNGWELRGRKNRALRRNWCLILQHPVKMIGCFGYAMGQGSGRDGRGKIRGLKLSPDNRRSSRIRCHACDVPASCTITSVSHDEHDIRVSTTFRVLAQPRPNEISRVRRAWRLHCSASLLCVYH